MNGETKVVIHETPLTRRIYLADKGLEITDLKLIRIALKLLT